MYEASQQPSLSTSWKNIDSGKGSSPQLVSKNPGRALLPDNSLVTQNDQEEMGCLCLHPAPHNVKENIDSGIGSSTQFHSNHHSETALHHALDPISRGTSNKSSNPDSAFSLLKTTLRDEHPHINATSLMNHIHRISSFWPNLTQQPQQEFPAFAASYNNIKALNRPNFIGARVTLDSGLNVDLWEKELTDYHNKEICHFLRFRWPVRFEADSPLVSVSENHQAGQLHLPHIRKFIGSELSHGAIVGLFSNPPFHPWTRGSPILTRPKKDSSNRRIIIDLSFPKGEAVDQGIDITSIFGRDSTYVLPTIGDLTNAVTLNGKGTWMWKGDLARAYRQLRVDPLDCPLLGMQVDGQFYIDLCPSFGCRSSSSACQRTSNALVYIMAKAG